MEAKLNPIVLALMFFCLTGLFTLMGFGLNISVFLGIVVVIYVGYAFGQKNLTDIPASINKVTCSSCRYDNKVGALVCKNCKTRL